MSKITENLTTFFVKKLYSCNRWGARVRRVSMKKVNKILNNLVVKKPASSIPFLGSPSKCESTKTGAKNFGFNDW